MTLMRLPGAQRGMQVVIPPRNNRKQLRQYDVYF